MNRLTIDRLHLTFANGAGQEHRVRPIARRALALLHDALRSGALIPAEARLERIALPPLRLDLTRLTDEAAAGRVAAAIAGAISVERQPAAAERPAAAAPTPVQSSRMEAPCRR
jgi:hypothetical protein